MKSELVAGVIAAMLPIAALAAAQAPQSTGPHAAGAFSEVSSVSAPTPTLPLLGSTSYIAFGVEPAGLAALDLNAPVTHVVTGPPPAAPNTQGDDEVEPAGSPPMESSTFALMFAGLGVLLFIGHRLRRD
jgi:hypothetical protein